MYCERNQSIFCVVFNEYNTVFVRLFFFFLNYSNYSNFSQWENNQQQEIKSYLFKNIYLLYAHTYIHHTRAHVHNYLRYIPFHALSAFIYNIRIDKGADMRETQL